jgi:WD40 repeat protein
MSLVFFSDCARPGKSPDLYAARLFAGPPVRLATLPQAADDAAFSPDGSRIAFIIAGAGEARRIALVAADRVDQKVIPVSPASLSVREFDWAPDGHALVYAASDAKSGGRIYVQKLPQASEAQPVAGLLLDPENSATKLRGLDVALPRWSPDGKRIAFLAGSAEARGTVWTVRTESGEARNLSQGRPTAAAWWEWEDVEHLFVGERAGANTQLLRYRLPEMEGDAAGYGAPIFSIPGSVDDGRGCFSLSATADHSLFVFRAAKNRAAPQIYGAKPGVVMNAGIEGVLELSYAADPKAGVTAPSAPWTTAGEHLENWRCHPSSPQRRHPLQ